MRHIESNIQQACVKWFRMQYKAPEHLIFAIPNGGARNKVEAARMKSEGVLAGVSDLCILSSGQTIFVELKTDIGRQSTAQLTFQTTCDKQQIPYFVVRSVEEFIGIIDNYIKK